MKLLELDSVSVVYGEKKALDGLNLGVHEGERLVILGPSGCGKTTVLRLFAGLLSPDRGRVLIAGRLAAEKGRLLIQPEKRGLGMVFQDLALWPHLSVAGNLELGLRARRIARPERRRRIHEMLELVELKDSGTARPGELSGGQQQRVALARALVLKPHTLLMDEPLSSLDIELNQRLRREILRLQAHMGFTLIYVTHDHEEACELATRILIMEKGRAVRECPVDEFECKSTGSASGSMSDTGTGAANSGRD